MISFEISPVHISQESKAQDISVLTIVWRYNKMLTFCNFQTMCINKFFVCFETFYKLEEVLYVETILIPIDITVKTYFDTILSHLSLLWFVKKV